MGIFGKHNNMADVIRCDEPSYLIWKWHPEGFEAGKNKRENAIRFGSSLRVKDGEVAVFVYNQKGGSVEDYIEGPFDQILSTANLPIISGIIGLAYGGDSPFQAEVYFINLAQIIQIRFGVPFFEVFDPRFADFGVPVAVRGSLTFNITDYFSFVKLHRLISFDVESFKKEIQSAVIRYVKNRVANAPSEHNIPLLQIETKLSMINEAVELDIRDRLATDFGVNVTGVDIDAIEIDKTADSYDKLMAVTRDVTTATVEAETAANIKNIYDKQRIDIENYEETLRIQRTEGQYAQHKKTQTDNFDAYKIEASTKVGVAGAEALGQMNANGAGSVGLGGGGTGFNPAAMMAGMALGGAVGQNIAGTMNGIMGAQQENHMQTPPPIPSGYYVAKEGKPIGPFELSVIRQMIEADMVKAETLVWKEGMESWAKAADLPDLTGQFTENKSEGTSIPPIA